MKLNYKRTLLVGLAFLSISTFWQLYDGVIPLILTETLQLNEVIGGVIMAADNVCALILLPLFGALSDSVHTRFGRRMPFILCGTAFAVVLMNFLPMLDNSYYRAPSPAKLTLFVVILGLLLISMGIYRSPAVALMPDVTPKPLRSKANAVINLMGAVGGILYLLITQVLYSKERTEGLAHVDYTVLFLIVAAIMVISVVILFFTTDENRLRRELAEYEAAHPEESAEETPAPQTEGERRPLPPDVKRSLAFLLLSISFWFIGYNGITTWFTTYAANIWNMSLGQASSCLTVGMAGAIVSYIPIGMISGRIGRKRTILGGVALLAACFFAAFVTTLLTAQFTPVLYVLFAVVGLAWAAINVNSLPMVVEMCRSEDVGRYTGYYYTFSMAAQIVTPVLAGWLMRTVDYRALFPYSTVFAALAFLTMTQVRHGDNRPTPKMGLEALDVDAD